MHDNRTIKFANLLSYNYQKSCYYILWKKSVKGQVKIFFGQ